jgi:aspartokinase
MLKISEAVKKLVEAEPELHSPLKNGFINLSAYAKKIHVPVEALTKKSVQTRSIVVTLSRLAKTLPKTEEEKNIKILRLSVYADLEELSYEKTTANLQKLTAVYKKLVNLEQNFLAITQSLTEITMVGDQNLMVKIRKNFGGSYLFHKKNLTGISLKFPLSYLTRPNVIYNLIKRIAVKKINITEVISSSSELTIIIDNKDAALALGLLNAE